MPLIATRGAASAQGFGEFAQSAAPVYIEDVFSTYLYTGNSSTQTITNGIDLSTKGGLVWTKNRSSTQGNAVFDTVRGNTKYLLTQTTDADQTSTDDITGFLSNGYTLGNNATTGNTNYTNYTYASWTFREQPKFFDIVTYVGNADTTPSRTVNHNLGSVPGCIIVKEVTQTGNWDVYHRSLGATKVLFLNLTNASSTDSLRWNDTEPTSTQFTVGSENNSQGVTYVAYLFAHNAGGFGLTGSDNVISCGSYTGDGTSDGSKFVSLGYEPQWLLIKRSNSSTNGAWVIVDNMRGIVTSNSATSNDAVLEANSTAAENLDGICQLSATGFNPLGGYSNINGATYIYIAIRRGPMKTPTSGTSVFTPTTYTGNGTSQTESAGFPTDMAIITNRGSGGGYERNVGDRLRGGNRTLFTTLTVAENTATNRITAFDNMVGVAVGSDGDVNQSSGSQIAWNFRRAPGFFDVVCYTGTGSATTFSHNLGVVPEMMIVKRRSAADNWFVYSQTLGNTKHIALDGSSGASGSSSAYWNNTSPTASVFSVGNDSAVNASASTYVNYLFASCPGVSKVGSYTGTGTTLQIDCGFTGGARWVMIKRTDSTGDWYVWDSARGIVAGNDPYLLLNSTAAEVTNTDYVDAYSAGFEISSTAPAAINANGGTFIFLAVA